MSTEKMKNIEDEKLKVMHKSLTEVFLNAFLEARKEGVSIKSMHWFNSELQKDLKQRSIANNY